MWDILPYFQGILITPVCKLILHITLWSQSFKKNCILLVDILWVIWTWRQKGESKYTSWVFFWLEVSTKCLWYSSTSFDWSQWTCCLSDLNSFLILLLRDLSSIPQNGVDGVLVPCFHSTSACNQAALNLWSGWKVEMTSVLLVFSFWHSSCKGRLKDSALILCDSLTRHVWSHRVLSPFIQGVLDHQWIHSTLMEENKHWKSFSFQCSLFNGS